MQYIGLKQEISLFPAALGELYGSYTHANPGYTLQKDHIFSNNINFGAAFDYNLIRQRSENLSVRAAFEAQNLESDILALPLTRDYIRALRFGLNYQRVDLFDGQNAMGVVLSQGLPIFGASPAGQADLSRAGARPDFTKVTFSASHLQRFGDSWGLLTALSAQLASGPLYSAEQFGYGGQTFGRAYDSSAIIGDEGMDGAVELGYSGIAPLTFHPPATDAQREQGKALRVQPAVYAFYDIGSVWNRGEHPAVPSASGSSAGMGLRLATDWGISTNAGFAFPLTHRIDDPISGNGRSPRYFVSIAYGF